MLSSRMMRTGVMMFQMPTRRLMMLLMELLMRLMMIQMPLLMKLMTR